MRRNKLRTLVSLDMATFTNKWRESRCSLVSSKQERIEIGIDDILERIKKIEEWEQAIPKMLNKNPY